MASELWSLVGERDWLLANGTLSGWARRVWNWERFGCYLGLSGGAGVGYGAGASIGAALATKGLGHSGRRSPGRRGPPLHPSALWTAAHHRIPLLFVMHNNRTYSKGRLHQIVISETRNRGSLDRVDLGIDIDDPPVDFAALAAAQGLEGFGAVASPHDLRPALEGAVSAVSEGRPALVDVVFDRPGI